MSEKPNLQIPLDLPDIEMVETEVTKTGDYIITVKRTLKGTACQQLRSTNAHAKHQLCVA